MAKVALRARPVDDDAPIVRLVNRTAMVSTWRDPDDVSPLRREAREVKGFRTACTLRRMALKPNSGITWEHIAAADQLRRAADLAAMGYTGDRPLWFVNLSMQPRSGLTAADLARNRAHREVARVLRLFPLPYMRQLLAFVILENHSLADWVRWLEVHTGNRVPPGPEKGRLLVILDTLAQHFASEIAQHPQDA